MIELALALAECSAPHGRQVAAREYEQALLIDQPLVATGSFNGDPLVVTIPAGRAPVRLQGDARTFVPADYQVTVAGRPMADRPALELVTYPAANDVVIRLDIGGAYREHDVPGAAVRLETCRA